MSLLSLGSFRSFAFIISVLLIRQTKPSRHWDLKGRCHGKSTFAIQSTVRVALRGRGGNNVCPWQRQCFACWKPERIYE